MCSNNVMIFQISYCLMVPSPDDTDHKWLKKVVLLWIFDISCSNIEYQNQNIKISTASYYILLNKLYF